MIRKINVFWVVGLLIFSLSPLNALDFDQASELIIKDILEDETTGVKAFLCPNLLVQDSCWIRGYGRYIQPPYERFWFAFIDEDPLADWCHPCKYLFIDNATGHFQVLQEEYPPRVFASFIPHQQLPYEAGLKFRKIADGVVEARPPEPDLDRIDEILRTMVDEPTSSNLYAVVISGGVDAHNNYYRYWNVSSFIYTTLLQKYGYKESQVFVLMSDGTSTGEDRNNACSYEEDPDYEDSDRDLDQDGDEDVDFSATHANVEAVFDSMAAIMTPNDQLYIFTTDHGGGGGTNDSSVHLCLWNDEQMTDTELASWIDAINCSRVIICMTQCYSGGFVDNLRGIASPDVVIATGCGYWQPHYSSCSYATFGYYWTKAVRERHPSWVGGVLFPYLIGGSVDSDTDDNGWVSTKEAFDYAEPLSQYWQDGTLRNDCQYYSTPSIMGDSVALTNVFYVPGTYTTIQGAASAALGGGHIFVSAGTYFENVTLNDWTNLSGEGWRSTFIDASTSGNVLSCGYKNNISYLSIQNSGNANNGIDTQDKELVTISNCRLYNNSNGIRCAGSEPEIINCLILVPGGAALTKKGIACSGAGISHPNISKCTIASINANSGNNIGLEAHYTTVLNLQDCVISNFNRGISCFSGTPDSFYIDHCNLWGNNTNYFGMTDQTGINGNISGDPCFVDIPTDDYSLGYGSACIRGASDGHEIGMFRVWEVRGASPDYLSIQAAVNAAKNGESVIAYSFSNTGNIVMKDGVDLCGAGMGSSILNGSYTGSVVTIANRCYLQGFRIGNSGTTAFDAGIECNNVTDFVIRNNDIMNNNCGIDLHGCTAGLIKNNLIHDNTQMGIDVSSSTVEINGNTIDSNSDGIYVHQISNATIKNNIITNNDGVASGFGIAHYYGPNTLTISYNNVWNNDIRDYAFYSSPAWIGFAPSPGTGEISHDPLFKDADYFLYAGSPCVEAGTPVETDIGARQFTPTGTTPTGFSVSTGGAEDQVIASWTSTGASGYYLYYGRPSGIYSGTEATEGNSPINVGSRTADTLHNILSGVTCYLAVSGYDASGNESGLSTERSGIPVDLTPPANVTGFSATAGDREIDIAWTNPATSDWAGTVILKRTDTFPWSPSTGDTVYDSTGTSYTDKGLTNGIRYYYTAFAYDEIPNYSAAVASAQDSATPADVEAPGPPDNLEATPGDGKVSLTWDNPDDLDWAGTIVMRKTGDFPTSVADGDTACDSAASSCVDTGLTNGTLYFYAAWSYDEVPNHSVLGLTARDFATPQDATPPTWSTTVGIQAIETDNSQVTVFWNQATDASSPPVEYNIYYSTSSPATAGLSINVESPTVSTNPAYDYEYTVNPLTNGDKYYFIIRAQDSRIPANEDTNRVELTGMPEYYTPGTGVTRTLSQMVTFSNGGIRGSIPDFTMHGNVTISAGDQLTLNPNETLSSVDNSGTKKLIINGIMIADGGSYIAFNSAGGHKGDWGGIEINSPNNSLMDNCIVEHAVTGITWQGKVNITYSYIRNNSGTGIDALLAPDDTSLIDNNVIQSNDGDGLNILCDSNSVCFVRDNTITGNGGDGVAYFALNPWVNLLEIGFNDIRNNTGDGIDCSWGGNPTMIHDNTITGNTNGLMLDQESFGPWAPQIMTNTISGNRASGIHCSNQARPDIIGNQIISNTANGVLCRNWAIPTLTGNTITSSRYGVYIDNATPDLGSGAIPGNNNIHSHSLYSVYNMSGNNINAQWNWWGNVTTAQMDGFPPPGYPNNVNEIFDFFENPAFGTVDYRNWLHLGNTPPTINIIDPPFAGGDADTIYTITWNDSDPEENALISLFYLDGDSLMPIPDGANLEEDDPEDQFDWNTTQVLPGIYHVVGIIDDGFTNSADTSDGMVNIEHPQLDLFPITISFTQRPDMILVDTLTITNVGNYNLNYTLQENVTWFSVSPVSGTLPASADDDIEVSCNSGGLMVGTYNDEIRVYSNDPFSPDTTVQVTLIVVEPDIAIDVISHDYRTVEVGDNRDWSFATHNRGGYELTLSSVDIGSHFSVTTPGFPFSVPPDDSVLFNLRFAPVSTGFIKDTLYILNDDPEDSIVEVVVSGNAFERLIVSDDSHNFGGVPVGEFADWEFYIISGDTSQFMVTGVNSDNIYFSVQSPGFPLFLAPEESCAVLVRFTPTSITPDNAILSVCTDIPGGDTLEVNLGGFGLLPELSLTDTFHDFQGITAGDSRDWIFHIRNIGDCQLIIHDVESYNGNFMLPGGSYPAAIPVGDSLAVTVRFTPITAGLFFGEVGINSNDSEEPYSEVEVIGMADMQDIELAVNFHSYGEVEIFTVAYWHTRFYNRGPCALTITGLSSDNPDFILPGIHPPLVVPSYEHQPILVNFYPSTLDSIFGTLTVTSNDPDEGIQLIYLNGVGVPEVAVEEGKDFLPREVDVLSNYPNPFNSYTVIMIDLRALDIQTGVLNKRFKQTFKTCVYMEIYDIRGRKIREFMREVNSFHILRFNWDGQDSEGNLCTSGIYFYKIEIGEETHVNKMLLIR